MIISSVWITRWSPRACLLLPFWRITCSLRDPVSPGHGCWLNRGMTLRSWGRLRFTGSFFFSGYGLMKSMSARPCSVLGFYRKVFIRTYAQFWPVFVLALIPLLFGASGMTFRSFGRRCGISCSMRWGWRIWFPAHINTIPHGGFSRRCLSCTQSSPWCGWPSAACPSNLPFS